MKEIEVEGLEPVNWPAGVPKKLAAVATAGKATVNSANALLATGARTRPPRFRGFALGDTWAWLRYAPALSAGARLRLVPAWEDIDPHQKTVLSDEVGVGFTTNLLTTHLDFIEYADTRYLVAVSNPGALAVLTSSRRGPAKTPDYVAIDASGALNLVECKGTQTRRGTLRDAVDTGIVQKNNVGPRRSKLALKIVAGLYIPQASHKEEALFRLVDPEWESVESALEGVPLDRLRAAVVQIALAKYYHLVGAHFSGNYLGSTTFDELSAEEFRRESSKDRGVSTIASDTAAFGVHIAGGTSESPVVFRGARNIEDHAALLESNNLGGTLVQLAEELPRRFLESQVNASQIGRALGFTFELELTGQQHP